MPENLLTIIPRGKDNGAWSTTISAGSTVTIPAGYHNGKGTVTANKGTFHRVDCGYMSTEGANTKNLKSYLPNVYNKITVDNIFCEAGDVRLGSNDPSDRVDYNETFTKSYNPSTGILSIPMSYYWYINNRLNGGLRSVHVFVCYAD